MNIFRKSKIFVRDLFKPRYAIIIGTENIPWFEGKHLSSKTVPAFEPTIYKRPFLMPWNDFYEGICYEKGYWKKALFGSSRMLKSIRCSWWGICMDPKRAELYKPDQDKIEAARKIYAEQTMGRMCNKFLSSRK